MAQAVGKYAANKFLKKQMKGYANKKVEGADDPYFAMIEDPRRPGKFKKVKKHIPHYIPEHDAMILAKVRKSAYRLDMCLFNLFGIRFGWEAVIGLIPFLGDAIGILLALNLVRLAQGIDGGLPSTLRMRMMINITLDFLVGLVPFIGDLADAAFKCNTKNARLLELHLDAKYKPGAAGADARDETPLSPQDRAKREQNRRSGIFHPRDPPPATVFDVDDSDEEEMVQGTRPVRAARTQETGSAVR